MSDLTPEQQAYLRARQLTRPDGIQRTLEELDRGADETSSLGRPLGRLCEDAALTIRYLRQQLELREKVSGWSRPQPTDD